MIDEKFGPVGNDRYRDYLRDINRSGNHVLDLVNDLLDISKIEAGEQEMTYEAVSLNDTLRNRRNDAASGQPREGDKIVFITILVNGNHSFFADCFCSYNLTKRPYGAFS